MQEEFDLKRILSIYIKQWKWFIISSIAFISLAFIYLRYATPEYNAYAKIMLTDNNGVTNPGETLLKNFGQFSNSENEKIEDEIEVLKSRKLMENVVKKLDLNKQFFVKGRLHDTQLFPNTKAPIKISFISSDSIIDNSNFDFSLKATSETTFNFTYKSKKTGEEIVNKSFFGKAFSTSIGDIVITPNVSKLSSLLNEVIYVKINSLYEVSENYKNKIRISQVAELSKVINLSLNDPSVIKAITIINTLIAEYNRISIEEKSTMSNNTAEFINKRIDLITTDLAKIDNLQEQFKTGSKLTNITSETDLYLNANAQTEQDLASIRTEHNMVNYMKSQVRDDDSFSRIPLNVGLADGSINSLATKYNELLNDRERLLKSSNEKNPIVVNLDQQINSIKMNLKQSLNNSSKAIGLRIRSLENQSAKISSKIYAVPGQVRKSRDIAREQGIKESVYLFLLQEREKATISLISTSPNARVIDEAHSTNIPVSPKRMMVYIAALFLGVCVPFSFIYVKDLLDNKIHNKEDLENEVNNITVLGEIPHLQGKKDNKLIIKNDRSILSESFRIIRTNFDYIKRGRNSGDYNNVVFVTSTINGEGKSFFSMNIALTLANTNKRVLVIGADIRNPQTDAILNKKNKSKIAKVGLTEYLVDDSVIVGETINTYDINGNNIDVMFSGKVPPNPAELLMSNRMKPLFDKVSEQYDYVIVDTAPSMLVTDTLLFSQYAGHTIYMTRADYTEKRILNFAKELHASKKLNGMMLVVNDVKQSNFGYGARYGYYGASEKKSWFKRKA